MKMKTESDDIMKHCDKCNIDVRGSFKRCPLCQHILTGENTPDEFPAVQSFYEKYKNIVKFAILITSSISIISIAVNILIPQSGKWSLFVLFGVICFWITATVCMKKRRVISQNISAEAVIISILCVIWDAFTGWHGWSVDYVIPIIFSWAMLGLFIATKILKIRMPDYVFSFVICIFFGIAPLILCLAGVTKILIPSVICIALSIMSFITLLLYDGRELWLTLSKKFHI